MPTESFLCNQGSLMVLMLMTGIRLLTNIFHSITLPATSLERCCEGHSLIALLNPFNHKYLSVFPPKLSKNVGTMQDSFTERVMFSHQA